MKTVRVIWLSVLALALAGTAFVLPSSGRAFQLEGGNPSAPDIVQPLTSLPGEEYSPDIAYDPDQDLFLLAYGHYLEGGEVWQQTIEAQLVNAEGTPVFDPILLSGYTPPRRDHPAAAYKTGAYEFLVIWDFYITETDHNIMGRWVSDGGAAIGSAEFAIDASAADDTLPDLAFNPAAEEFLAVWERYQDGQSEIYAQRLDLDGAPIPGGGFFVADDSIDESGAAVVVDSATGEYLVVWHQQTAEGNYDVYGQRITALGLKIGGLIQISTSPGNQMFPQLASRPDYGQYLVVWQDERTDSDIYAQILSSSGSLVGTNFAVADSGSSPRQDPQVAYQPNADDYMVTWAVEAGVEDIDVYRRRVTRDGSLPEAEVLVSGESTLETRPTIAAGGFEGYLLAWEDSRNYDTGLDIYSELTSLNRIRGHVYEGLEGDLTTPLDGVTVELYGSNNSGEAGALLDSMVTASGGWFVIIAPTGYEYYNLIENNLDGYTSIAAVSNEGSIITPDWIQYSIPLEEKDLRGNNFWDLSEASGACGGEFSPTADASVDMNEPDTNYGSGQTLFVAHSLPPGYPTALTFMQFDLAGKIPPEAVIHSATLELTLSRRPRPSADLELGFASLPREWDEASVTWNSQPEAAFTFPPKYYTTLWSDLDPVMLRMDVSTLVNLWATGEHTPTSLALVPGDEQMSLSFYSRESDHPPRLVVTCSPYLEPLPRAYDELNARQLDGIARLAAGSAITSTVQLGESGAVRFAMFDITPPSVYTDSLGRAQWFTQVYSDVLRISDPEHDLQFVRRSSDDLDLFFRQRYRGIPVLGSEINLHFLGSHITGLSGTYLSDLELNVNPQIPAEGARQISLALGEPGAEVISEDQLRILNRGLFVENEPRSYLTWLVVLSQDGGEEFYIDAKTGALRFSQPRSLEVFDLDLETASHNVGGACNHWSNTTDDKLWCDENGCNSSATQEGVDAHTFIQNVYNYWQNFLGRDSFDNGGKQIQIYLNVGTNWRNAWWRGGCGYFEFGDDEAAQDIVGHEFSHAVADYTANLAYSNESGALDESFADINGAFVDGDWLIGENTPDGAGRSLQDPTIYGHPDKYSKIDFHGGWDFGGVHENSGIHNKAGYLATVGGNFNGVSIPAGGIGMDRARVLFYNTLKRLTANAKMKDARNAALAAAVEMAQKGTNGFTNTHTCYVIRAYHATELGENDLDCDGDPDSSDPDTDGDKLPNSQDNCISAANPDQKDNDKDGAGDACDPDDDDDGYLDASDNCSLVYNLGQYDTDSDGEGDACDDNDDGDTIPNEKDNCPTISNNDQLDTDGDGLGDVCDEDDDNDGVSDVSDNCRLTANASQANADGDPFGDACDLCPDFHGTDNEDPDNDGKGNSCDLDDDNDSVLDGADNCPIDYNPDQRDVDGDGNGWACDYDDVDILTTMLKMLTLKYNRDSPIRFPLPGCASCGGGYIDPLFREQISLVSLAGFYAQIVDSTGQVVDRTNLGSGDLLSQTLSFAPAPYANPALWELPGRPDPAAGLLPPDGVRYYLELFPAEGLDQGQTYTMTVKLDEYVIQEIYLPVVRR